MPGKLIKCEKCDHFTFPDGPCWDCGAPMGDASPLERREKRAKIFALIAGVAIVVLLILEAFVW